MSGTGGTFDAMTPEERKRYLDVLRIPNFTGPAAPVRTPINHKFDHRDYEGSSVEAEHKLELEACRTTVIANIVALLRGRGFRDAAAIVEASA